MRGREGGTGPRERAAAIVRSGRLPPADNMAIDEALLASAPGRPVLRLYGWSPPGLSLGHFQSDEEGAAALRSFPGAVIVRRPTGGGAIYHDDEVTYSLVVGLGDPLLEGASLEESYFRLDAPVVAALAGLGVAARHRGGDGAGRDRRAEPFFCFDRKSRLDVVAERGHGLPAPKIAGSAQRRSRTHVLQHGSVLLRGHRAIAGAAGVNDLLPAGSPPVGFDRLASLLESAFARGLGLRFEPAESP